VVMIRIMCRVVESTTKQWDIIFILRLSYYHHYYHYHYHKNFLIEYFCYLKVHIHTKKHQQVSIRMAISKIPILEVNSTVIRSHSKSRKTKSTVISRITVMVMFSRECTDILTVYVHDDDDFHLKKITTKVSQNLVLHKDADQPKA
jgi:hypothetical protein